MIKTWENVRRACNSRDAVRYEHPRHRKGHGVVPRAVVDTWKKVAVQINHAIGPPIADTSQCNINYVSTLEIMIKKGRPFVFEPMRPEYPQYSLENRQCARKCVRDVTLVVCTGRSRSFEKCYNKQRYDLDL